MKKLTGHVWVLWVIALAVTAALALLIPFEHNTVYWVAVGCTALMFVLVAVVFYCDTYYRGRIVYALTREENPIPSQDFIESAKSAMDWHRILLGLGVALTALLPVYTPLLKKLRTSVHIEDNGAMDTIDISGEDA